MRDGTGAVPYSAKKLIPKDSVWAVWES
jgi:hypothetical protein